MSPTSKRKKARTAKRTKKTWLNTLLVITALVSVCLIGGALILSSMLFGPKKSFNIKAITAKDMMLQSQLIQRILPQVSQSSKNDVAVIKLTSEEVNAIIKFLSNSDALQKFFNGDGEFAKYSNQLPYQLEFKDGKFFLCVSANTKFSSPWGQYILLTLTAAPILNSEGLMLSVNNATAGSITIPNSQAEVIFKVILDKYRDHENFRLLLDIIEKSFITQDGVMIVYYRPFRLRSYLHKSFLSSFI